MSVDLAFWPNTFTPKQIFKLLTVELKLKVTEKTKVYTSTPTVSY